MDGRRDCRARRRNASRWKEDQLWSINMRDYGKGVVGGKDIVEDLARPRAVHTRIVAYARISSRPPETTAWMPIMPRTDGGSHIVASTTTKHKNGAAFDYRARSSHIISIMDRWAD